MIHLTHLVQLEGVLFFGLSGLDSLECATIDVFGSSHSEP
jgi:hypothetical protein